MLMIMTGGSLKMVSNWTVDGCYSDDGHDDKADEPASAARRSRGSCDDVSKHAVAGA
jgi:hypothetical protein